MIGLTESSNMLHYSNPSMREWSGQYWDDQTGLAWLLWQGGVVVDDVVDHRGISGLGVYRREEGEEIMNTEQTKHHKI